MASDTDAVRAEVMRLHYLERLSIRAIARRLGLARRTVRRHLGKLPPRETSNPALRPSLLDPFARKIESMLEGTPELRAPQILERFARWGTPAGSASCAAE